MVSVIAAVAVVALLRGGTLSFGDPAPTGVESPAEADGAGSLAPSEGPQPRATPDRTQSPTDRELPLADTSYVMGDDLRWSWGPEPPTGAHIS